MENYRANNKSAYQDHLYSLRRCGITESKLAELNNVIKLSNDRYDLLLYNCVSFAIECWNTMSTNQLQLSGVDTPKGLVELIKSKSGYSTGYSFEMVSTPCYYDTEIEAMRYSSSYYSLDDEIMDFSNIAA